MTKLVNIQPFQCHKQVLAFEIGKIEGNKLYQKGDDEAFYEVSHEYIGKHPLNQEGYYVRYEDGYESFSPKEVFESGYSEIGSTVSGVMSDAAAEQVLAQSTGDRVTKEYIQSRIAAVAYLVVPETTVTICHIQLDNSFSVRGESACVDPNNFNQAVGEKYAYENAFEKLWQLFGFALAEQRSKRVEKIARVCHEVNRAYCVAMGDSSQPAWEAAPDWQKQSAFVGVELHLNNPSASAAASHASWYAQKDSEGWVWGPIKDPERKQHPCMVAFDDLPREQQAKDYLFRGVVHALAT